MKSKTATLALMLMVGTAFGQQDEQSVAINGVEWATRNVADSGNFAENSEACSHYYQWNRGVGMAPGDYFDPFSSITDPTWTVNPCPQDWRMATHMEAQSLMSAGSTWAAVGDKGNLVAGRFYGPNHANATISNPSGTVFMPACGYYLGHTPTAYGSNGAYYYGQE